MHSFPYLVDRRNQCIQQDIHTLESPVLRCTCLHFDMVRRNTSLNRKISRSNRSQQQYACWPSKEPKQNSTQVVIRNWQPKVTTLDGLGFSYSPRPLTSHCIGLNSDSYITMIKNLSALGSISTKDIITQHVIVVMQLANRQPPWPVQYYTIRTGLRPRVCELLLSRPYLLSNSLLKKYVASRVHHKLHTQPIRYSMHAVMAASFGLVSVCVTAHVYGQ